MRAAALCCLGLLLVFDTLAAQTPSRCLGVSGAAYVNWLQFHSDLCHTGYNARESILSPATVGNLVRDWGGGAGASIVSSPAVANGVVYFGADDNRVYAVNAATGSPLWSFSTGDTNQVVSSPAVANGVVYVGSTWAKSMR